MKTTEYLIVAAIAFAAAIIYVELLNPKASVSNLTEASFKPKK